MVEACYSLPHKFPPMEGESLLGYLFRLSDLEGMKTLDRLYQVAGYPYFHRRFIAHDIGPLAFLVGSPAEKLLRMNFNLEMARELGSRACGQFRGHILPSTLVDQVHPKICTSCLRENPVLRDTWELALLLACPFHCEYLTRQCSACGKRILWTRPGFLQCGCGHFIGNEKQKKAPPGLVYLMRIVTYSVGDELGELAGSDLPIELTQMKPGELMPLLILVGYCGTGRGEKSLLRFRALSFEEQSEILGAAYKYLSHWPENFRKLLGIIAHHRDGRGRNSLLDTFLRRIKEQDSSRFVLDEFKKFVESYPRGKAKTLGAREIKFKDLGEASVESGIHIKVLLKNAKAGGLKLKRLRRRGWPEKISVDKNSLKAFRIRAANRMSVLEARRVLGLDINAFRRAMECRFLSPDYMTAIEPRHDFSLVSTEVMAFWEKLQSLVKPVSELPEGSKLFKFNSTLNGLNPNSFQACELLQAVFEGDILIYTSNAKGNFQDVFLPVAQAREFMIDCARERNREWMTFGEAEKKFHIPGRVLRGLVRKGGIDYIRRNLGKCRYEFVPEPSLEKWLGENMRTGEIVRYLGLSPAKVKDIFTRYGVSPSFSQGGQTWFKKSSVEGLKKILDS